MTSLPVRLLGASDDDDGLWRQALERDFGFAPFGLPYTAVSAAFEQEDSTEWRAVYGLCALFHRAFLACVLAALWDAETVEAAPLPSTTSPTLTARAELLDLDAVAASQAVYTLNWRNVDVARRAAQLAQAGVDWLLSSEPTQEEAAPNFDLAALAEGFVPRIKVGRLRLQGRYQQASDSGDTLNDPRLPYATEPHPVTDEQSLGLVLFHDEAAELGEYDPVLACHLVRRRRGTMLETRLRLVAVNVGAWYRAALKHMSPGLATKWMQQLARLALVRKVESKPTTSTRGLFLTRYAAQDPVATDLMMALLAQRPLTLSLDTILAFLRDLVAQTMQQRMHTQVSK